MLFPFDLKGVNVVKVIKEMRDYQCRIDIRRKNSRGIVQMRGINKSTIVIGLIPDINLISNVKSSFQFCILEINQRRFIITTKSVFGKTGIVP